MSVLDWPFDDIGSALGEGFKDMVGSAFEAAMTAIWQASLAVLRTAFQLADAFSMFSVSTTEGPLKIVWPMMLWISGVLAFGLFCWQLIMTNLRGGRGFLRLVTGPVQYGIALAVTVGMVATFLTAVDGLSEGILSYGLDSRNFGDALTHTSFTNAAGNGVKAVVLGICAIGGVIPAALGYVLEMLFREAAIHVLVCTVPLVAAGLVANVTASWFWRTVRWMLAAITMKPALALALVLGVTIVGGAQGVAGLLAGIGVLLISLFAPFLLFRLFSFVDPHTDAGGALREFLSGEGVDSYGPGNPGLSLAGAGTGSTAIEDANTGRFDDSIDEADEATGGSGDSCAAGHNDQDIRQDFSGGHSGDLLGVGRSAGVANAGQVVTSDGWREPGGDDPPPPPGNPGGHGGGGPRGGGEAGAGGAEEAAVIL